MSREKNLETMLTLVVAGIVLFVICKSGWILYAAILIGVIGLLFKKLSSSISRLWIWLAETLGSVISRIILSAIYILLLLPVAMFVRLFSRDPMQLSRRDRKSSYIIRHHTFRANDLINPW
jgi:hypothetical protein